MLSRHRCWRTPPETSSARRNRTTAHPSFSRSAAAKEGPAPCLCSCPASAMQSLQQIEIEPSAVFQPCHWEDSSSCKLWEVVTMQRSGFEPRQAPTREIGVLGRCSLRLSPAYGTSLASLPDLKLIAFHCQSQLAILFCGLRPLLKHEHPTKTACGYTAATPPKERFSMDLEIIMPPHGEVPSVGPIQRHAAGHSLALIQTLQIIASHGPSDTAPKYAAPHTTQVDKATNLLSASEALSSFRSCRATALRLSTCMHWWQLVHRMCLVAPHLRHVLQTLEPARRERQLWAKRAHRESAHL